MWTTEGRSSFTMSTVDSASAAAGWNATSARGMVPFAACLGTAVGAGANSAAAIGVEVASTLADGVVPLIESTAAAAATGVSPGVAICSGEIEGGAVGTGVAEAVEALPDEPNDKPCEQAARAKAPMSETANIRFRRLGYAGPLGARSRVQPWLAGSPISHGDALLPPAHMMQSEQQAFYTVKRLGRGRRWSEAQSTRADPRARYSAGWWRLVVRGAVCDSPEQATDVGQD